MSEEFNVEKKGAGPLVRYGIFGAVVLIAFLAGLVPMAIQKWSVEDELAATRKKLRETEVRVLLTTAIVDAKRGEYESARQNASGFFTLLDSEQDAAADVSFLKPDAADALKPVFAERDAIITLLAQRDPASVERLTTVYLTYLKAIGQPATTTPAAPQTGETPGSQ